MFSLVVFGIVVVASCRKEPTIVPNNNIGAYDAVPTTKIENYVNKLFIDVISRKPLDAELSIEVAALKTEKLSVDARKALVLKLMMDKGVPADDSSYNYRYYRRFYELVKTRMLENISDDDIEDFIEIFKGEATKDSLNGNDLEYQIDKAEEQKLRNLLNIDKEYKQGKIDIAEVFKRTINNYFYDDINMNAVNYVRACFNDLYYRLPTQEDLDNGAEMIDFNGSGILLGRAGQNKGDVMTIVLENNEFYQGLVIWQYKNLLARSPSSLETNLALNKFLTDKNLQSLQTDILITDEYAGF